MLRMQIARQIVTVDEGAITTMSHPRRLEQSKQFYAARGLPMEQKYMNCEVMFKDTNTLSNSNYLPKEC